MAAAPKKILIADDEADILEIVTYNLELHGYEVFTAKDGDQALKMAKEVNPDLIILDIMMPEMDGIELAQRCAEISPATKVMFITGFAAVTLKANREAPQAKVLSKPFHLRDLVLEVERIFGNQTQALV